MGNFFSFLRKKDEAKPSFGGFNDSMFGIGHNGYDGTEIVQGVTSRSVLNDLLEGRVTKEVEELRWRMYMIDREADFVNESKRTNVPLETVRGKYRYNGKVSFVQPNDIVNMGLNESMERFSNGDVDCISRRVKLKYKSTPIFKLEKFIKNVHVEVDESKNKHIIGFEFMPKKLDNSVENRKFNNRLDELIRDANKVQGFFDCVSTVSFTTFNAKGEMNNVSYDCIDLKYPKLNEINGAYFVTYICGSIQRLDVLDKYKSESMEKKYNDKEAKKKLYLNEEKETFKCVSCKADISMEQMIKSNRKLGVALCDDCLKKCSELYGEK